MNNWTRIEANKGKMMLYLAVNGIVFLTGFFILINLGRMAPGGFRTSSIVAVALTMPVAGAFGYYFLRRLWRKEPLIWIGEDRIVENATWSAAGDVLFEDIKGFSLVKQAGAQFVLVQVGRPHSIASRYGGLRGNAIRSRVRRFGTPVVIPMRFSAVPAEELIHRLSEAVKGA